MGWEGTRVDRIIEYFQGDLEDLTTEDEAYLEELQQIYAMMMKGKAKAYIVKAFSKLHPKYKQRLIYRRIDETEEVFGSLHKVNREIAQQFAIEKAMKAVKWAEKIKSPKELSLAVNAYMKATGTDRDPAEQLPIEKLQPTPVIAAIPEEALSVMQQLLAGGAINLNTPPTVEAEPKTIEIDYEDAED